jgi:hypothetical protein
MLINNIFLSVHAICRPTRSATITSSSALVLDTATFFIRLARRVPAFIYALLVGLVIIISAELVLSARSRIGTRPGQSMKAPMASILNIPQDMDREEFPFPGGATFQLYVSPSCIFFHQQAAHTATNPDAERLS